MSGAIHVTRHEDGVVLIQIDNPPTNALGSAIRATFSEALRVAHADLSVRAVVLTGQGGAFCSGDDLREMAGRDDDGLESLDQFARLFAQIESCRVPVIAAVNGYAAGGGLEIAASCDIRLASTDAKFIGAGVNVGLMASAYRLPRVIGVARAKAMLLTGLPTDAATALDWGLVTAVHERDALLGEALVLARRIATRAPLSIEATKRMTSRALHLAPEDAERLTTETLEQLARSSDHKEGLAAFHERRTPVFTRS